MKYTRFVLQMDKHGMRSYGYHSSRDDNSDDPTPNPVDADHAQKIKRLNGAQAIALGFTNFFVCVVTYKDAGTKERFDRQPKQQWEYIRASECKEIRL